MIEDARELATGSTVSADVCVIGSGPAGTTLARDLGRRGVAVLLLEAGGKKSDGDAEDALKGDPGDGFHDPLEKVRQRRLGGTSAQWGGRCMPFDPIDFAERSGLRGGWPIGYETMLPWYRKAAEVLELGSWDWDLESAKTSLPEPLPPGGDIGADRVWRWSPPVRFWERYGAELTASSRVRVLHHAVVVGLDQEISDGPVTRARISLGGGRTAHAEARIFVVAAGGLETARLMLAGTTASPLGLGNAGNQLGRNYMVHPLAEVGSVRVRRPELLGAAGYVRSHDGVWVRPVLTLRPKVLAAEGLPSMGFALWYPDPRDPSHGDPLLSSFALVRAALARFGGFKGTGMHRRYAELKLPGQHVANVARGVPELTRYTRYWARERWRSERTLPSFSVAPPGAVYRLRFDGEQLPDPRNRVTLSRDHDAHGMPRLKVEHSVTATDRDLLYRGASRAFQALTATGSAEAVPPTRAEFDALPLNDGTHQMGLARMSARPEGGVVDPDLLVHGTSNTFVASSAVFPTSGMCGPTMTIVALSLRLADHVASRLSVPAPAGRGV